MNLCKRRTAAVVICFFCIYPFLCSSEKKDKKRIKEAATLAFFAGAQEGDLYKMCKAYTEGANINYVHQNGETPLIVASKFGHKDIVERLIVAGAVLNKKASLNNSCEQRTALGWARVMHHEEIVELLQKAGAQE